MAYPDTAEGAEILRRDFLRMTAMLGAMTLAPVGMLARAAGAASADGAGVRYRLTGWLKAYVDAVTEHWLKVVPASNPAILDMFRDRERHPQRDLLCWSGEFAGKYLTSCVEVYRLSGDPGLREAIRSFVADLLPLQSASGYLGPWREDQRLSGNAVNPEGRPYKTWDAWGHYHAMLGLIRWFDVSGDPAALAAARRIGDLLDTTFATKRLVDIGTTEVNLAPIHALCLLYQRTGEERYLRLAEKIRDEFALTGADGKPLAGDYFRAALAGKEFFEMPRPRWESLHSVLGLAGLYRATGESAAREAFERIWWSIVKGDRHNNGGFSSGEQARGNPYDPRPIETCCTIAWTALSVEMLLLTENPVVADELELSLYNSVIGMHSPSGRWATYNTPMDGVRKASAHDIVFQAREGSPELNCCSVNSARGFGLVADWAAVVTKDGINLNAYAPGAIRATLPGSGGVVDLVLDGSYPAENRVRVRIDVSQPTAFTLRLRIPAWSRTTGVAVNGEAQEARAGTYLTLARTWSAGDEVTLAFDFSLQYWAGERECAGKASIYRGPLLLTYDRRLNPCDPDAIPGLDARGLEGRRVRHGSGFEPQLVLEFPAEGGRTLRLCDFGSAGVGGSPYRSWLVVANAPASTFSRENPRRTRPLA